MRPVALAALALGLVAPGCGPKERPAAPDPAAPAVPAAPAAGPDADRKKWLAGLRAGSQKARETAMDELSWLAEDDPAVLAALVELLRDKTTAGPGRTLPNQINSAREAAARALLLCSKGEAVLKEKGLPVLREGLTDPGAAVREHTAYTLGQLGALAKPLAADVQKLCTDPDPNVRGVAFDALRSLGVSDPVALARLLGHPEEDVVRLAAELIPLVPAVPAGAVEALGKALASENTNVSVAAAEGLAAAGPTAAPAAPALVDTIRKSYPNEPPERARIDGPELAYWRALARIGGAAVGPVEKLLEHPNLIVRALAARTLAEIGPPAKPAIGALKKALTDATVNVAVEAAVALVRIGEPADEPLAVFKRALDAPVEGVAAYAIEAVPRLRAAGKPLVPLALAKLSDKSALTRYAALWLVSQVPPEEGARAVPEVAVLVTDEQVEVRRLVGRVLERLGPTGAGAADALGKALATETEPDVRNQFVEALLAMGTGAKPAVPQLLPLVADANIDLAVRAKVAVAVAVADPASPAAGVALLKAASDADPVLRAAAADALGRLNPLPAGAVPALVKMARSDDKNGPRVAALRALVAAGPRATAAKPDLEAISNGTQPWLALWAKVALSALDGDVRRSAPVVRRALAEKGAQTRAAAVEALLIVGVARDDLPVLLKFIKDVNGPTKVAAATALGQLGPLSKDAVPDLVRALDHNDSDVRVAAADALGLIGPAARPAVPKLKELRPDPLARPAALRALERIEKK